MGLPRKSDGRPDGNRKNSLAHIQFVISTHYTIDVNVPLFSTTQGQPETYFSQYRGRQKPMVMCPWATVQGSSESPKRRSTTSKAGLNCDWLK